MTKKVFKQQMINGCQCWDCGQHRVVKQKDAEIYHAYKATTPKKKGGSITSYSSVNKVVLRIESHNDEKTGKKVKTKIIGPKSYPTLEKAMADCK